MGQASLTGSAGVLCFLIADIRGYTSFTKAHGSERAAALAAAFAGLCREAVEAHDGTVIELRGDEALATFASPRQALRAATQLQIVAADESALNPDLPLNFGIGIDVGEAVPVENGYRGEALNFAARLCSAAAAGEILASEAVSLLAGGMDGITVEPVDGLSLKGIGTQVRAGRIEAARPAALVEGSAASAIPVELDPLTPIFGRDSESRSLRWAWRNARRGNNRALVITGPTGIGKTRLAAEAAHLAARDGASIAYASAFRSGMNAILDAFRATQSPALLVVDDLESATDEDLAAIRAIATGQPPNSMLVAVATDDARPDVSAVLHALSAKAKALALTPITDDAVGQIVLGYATDADGRPPVRAIAEASGGRPAQVHELAATWARQQAAHRLGNAAAKTADGRRDLRQLESEVASNVIDLQMAQARLNLVGRAQRQAEDICPYMGLVAFDVGDAGLFYGRERLVAEMVGRLAGASFLAVVGPSGSGKSSAVRAGLLPALAAGALPGSEGWLPVVVRPGAQPMRELDRVLYASLSSDQRNRLSQATSEINEPKGDPLSAVAAVIEKPARLLLLVDQFEELFTIAQAAERDEFIAAVERTVAADAATVVIALRADFYGRCAAYPALSGMLGGGHILVGPMSATEYGRTIEGPARRAGLTIDPALVDALVLDVLDQPGALPLLSTALVELWEKREGRAIRLSAYAATGGVRGAVGRLAEAAYGGLSADEQSAARGLFLRLSAGDGDSVVRRRVPLADLDLANNAVLASVVKKLTDARLVTVDDGSIEVAHEALLREWPRLVGWLEEDRAGRRLREHLASTAREWSAAGRDPGELYRGTRLATAIDWTADHNLELTDTERSFLTESRAAAATEVNRQRRTNRRLRILLAASGIALLIAIGAGAFAFLQGQAAQTAARVADGQRLGAQGITESNLDLALLLGRQGLALDVDNVTRANMLSAIVRSPAAIGAWRPIPGRPLGVAVSPDGQTLLVWNNNGKGYKIDANTGAVIGDPVDAAFGGFTPDGSVWTGNQDSNHDVVVTAGNPRDNTVLNTVTIPQGAAAFAVSPDLSTYMTVSSDLLSIDVTDAHTGSVTRHIAAPPDTMILDVWPAGNDGVIAIRHDGTFDINDQQAANDAYSGPVKIDYYPQGTTQPAASIPAVDELFSLDPQNDLIAVHESGDSVGIYDLPSGKRRDFTVRHESLGGIALSPDGSFLMTSGDDKMLRVWDVNTGQLKETLAGHNGRVFSPAISQTGGHTTAWSVSLDGQLIEWDLTGDRSIDRPFNVGPGNQLNDGSMSLGMSVSPDGKLLATTGANGTVDIVDALSLSLVEQLQLDAGSTPFTVVFSPDSKTLVVGGEGPNQLQRFDVSTWQPIGDPLTGFADNVTPPGGDGSSQSPNIVRSVVYSPDGTTIAAGSEDGTIRFWDSQTGAPNRQPIDASGPVWDVAYSPDGKKIAATYREDAPVAGKAAVWDLSYGQQLYSVSVDDDYGAPWAVTFSHDGQTLATGGGIGYVRFWDAATGQQDGPPILADAGWVIGLQYNKDDSELIASGTDGTVRILDPVGRGQLGSALPGGDANSVATIGPDGRVFVVYEDDGHGLVWDVSLNSMETLACSVPGRTLTLDEWQRYLPNRPYDPACAASAPPTAGPTASP